MRTIQSAVWRPADAKGAVFSLGIADAVTVLARTGRSDPPDHHRQCRRFARAPRSDPSPPQMNCSPTPSWRALVTRDVE